MKANFFFFLLEKKFSRHGFNLAQRENIKLGDFCHFAPVAPNYLRAKIDPNKLDMLITLIEGQQ